MNKKNVVTEKNISKIATFIADSVDWLVANDMGCCHFNLSNDLAICVGWQSGYDMGDEDIIKSENYNIANAIRKYLQKKQK